MARLLSLQEGIDFSGYLDRSTGSQKNATASTSGNDHPKEIA
jgi:hypothetical protein